MNKLSVIIPAYNESASLPSFLPEVIEYLTKLNLNPWEVIVVDDGSSDETGQIVSDFHHKDTRIKLISLLRNEGKAMALQAGFDYADADIIITMDADGQDNPKELSRFISRLGEGFDMVNGWKKNRKDSFIKNNTSKFYNYFTNLLLREKLHDSNCGFKAYRKKVVRSLDLYGELHRYIPALVEASGFSLSEIEIDHRKRKFGKTKYGGDRFIKGALDLLTVLFITRFKNRPLHAFGSLGIIVSSVGIAISFYLSWLSLVDGQKIGDRPLLLLAVLLIVVGIQIVMTGLLGELITSIKKESKRYQIKEVTDDV